MSSQTSFTGQIGSERVGWYCKGGGRYLEFIPKVVGNHCKPKKRKKLRPGQGDKSESGLFPQLMSKLSKIIAEKVSAAIRPA